MRTTGRVFDCYTSMKQIFEWLKSARQKSLGIAATWALVPEWKSLRTIGSNSVIQRAYIWFFAVPLAAKFILQFKSPIKLMLWGQEHSIHLSLPFSWQQFFFASVAFTIGNLVFQWRCPGLVKEYLTPYDSYSAGNGSVFLCNELQQMPFEVMSEELRSELLYMFRRAEQASGVQNPSAQEWIDTNKEKDAPSAFELTDLILGGLCVVKREEMGDMFSLIYNAHSKCSPLSRLLVTSCYAVGFFLIAMVLYSNIVSVIEVVGKS